jgi:hypothetical protein
MDSQEFQQAASHLHQRLNRLQYRCKQIILCARMSETNISGLQELQNVLDEIEKRMVQLETPSV